MTERILRFVCHADIEAYAARGWIMVDRLDGTYHGQFAALMEWRGAERASALAPAEGE